MTQKNKIKINQDDSDGEKNASKIFPIIFLIFQIFYNYIFLFFLLFFKIF